MPMFYYKCKECEFVKEYMIGGCKSGKAPEECPECNTKDCMEKQFSMDGISGEVVGGYEYEYGKKSWKRNGSAMQQAGILAGTQDPY